MPARSILFGLSLALVTLAGATSAFAAEGFARTSTVLRAGPGTNYPSVARLSRGDGLEVYGCLSRATWCDVSDGGDRGWVLGNRIEFLRQGRRVRLSNDTGMFGLAILSFGLGDYWGAHYQSRPWVNDRRWNRRDTTRPPIPPRPRDYPAGARDAMPGADTPNRPMTARPERPAPQPPGMRPSQRGEASAATPPPVRRPMPNAGPGAGDRPATIRPNRPEPSRPPVMQQRPSGADAPTNRPPQRTPRPPQGAKPTGPSPTVPCATPGGCR
jgi:uncharacterized protein YraI